MPVDAAAAADTVLPEFDMPADVDTTGAGTASAALPAEVRPTGEVPEPTEVAAGDVLSEDAPLSDKNDAQGSAVIAPGSPSPLEEVL